MKITDIANSKGTRYTVYVDGEYWYNVDYEILLVHHLRIGLEVDEDFLDEVKRACERRKARERAYYLLGYRDHSKMELYNKLRESVSDEVALEVVTMVEEQGLVNDPVYAGKLARYYLGVKRWGRRRAEQEMRRRELDRNDIETALDECDVDPIEQLKAIIDRKYSHRLDDFKERQKVSAALMRLGFGFSEINTAVREYCEEHADDE